MGGHDHPHPTQPHPSTPSSQLGRPDCLKRAWPTSGAAWPKAFTSLCAHYADCTQRPRVLYAVQAAPTGPVPLPGACAMRSPGALLALGASRRLLSAPRSPPAVPPAAGPAVPVSPVAVQRRPVGLLTCRAETEERLTPNHRSRGRLRTLGKVLGVLPLPAPDPHLTCPVALPAVTAGFLGLHSFSPPGTPSREDRRHGRLSKVDLVSHYPYGVPDPSCDRLEPVYECATASWDNCQNKGPGV